MHRFYLICGCIVATVLFSSESSDAIEFQLVGANDCSVTLYEDGVLLASWTTTYPAVKTVTISADYTTIAIQITPSDWSLAGLVKGFTSDDSLMTSSNWKSTLWPKSTSWYSLSYDDSSWTSADVINDSVVQSEYFPKSSYSIAACSACDPRAPWFRTGLPPSMLGGLSTTVYYRAPKLKTTSHKVTTSRRVTTSPPQTTAAPKVTSSKSTTVPGHVSSVKSNVNVAPVITSEATMTTAHLATTPVAPSTRTTVAWTPVTFPSLSKQPTHYHIYQRNAKIPQGCFGCHLGTRTQFDCAARCSLVWPLCAGFQYAIDGDKECCLVPPLVLLYMVPVQSQGCNIWKAVSEDG